MVFVEPKTARSRRIVPIPPETIVVLAEQRHALEVERTEAGDRWKEHDLVFPSPIGAPREMSYLSYTFHRGLRKAGIPRLRIHDLRHTAATHLMVKHVNPKVVQDLLGHSTIAITLDTYSHVLPALAKEASLHMSGLVPATPESPETARE
jgi:integrase